MYMSISYMSISQNWAPLNHPKPLWHYHKFPIELVTKNRGIPHFRKLQKKCQVQPPNLAQDMLGMRPCGHVGTGRFPVSGVHISG